MRTRRLLLVAALLLISAGAGAQTPDAVAQPATSPVIADVGTINRIDLGVRGTVFSSESDQARYQRYQDLRDGPTVDRFRFVKSSARFLLNLNADHLGYLDQRVGASFENFGRVKATFDWDQTPLFYSKTTQTLFSETAPGVLVLGDDIQTGLQNRTLTLPNAVLGASTFDMKSRRDVATFNLVYSASRDVDLKFLVRNTLRNGEQPYAGTFGISGIIASELPAPIDHRTTEFGANVEWGNRRGFARVAYDGSFFRNDVTSLTWDNPLRASDSATAGPLQGRMALSPSSNMNTLSVAGGLNLPGRSRANGFLSLGNLTQNDPLLPFTINSAIASPALDRTTADLQARVIAMNYGFTSRPTNMLWFSARYRQYQFDNRSTPFYVGQVVNWDTSLATENEHASIPGYTRHTFDAETSVTPLRYVAFRGGYTREEVDRTFRIVEKTTEDTVRASIDLTGMSWLSLRGVYEHGERTGSEVNELELLEIGEQPSLRHFDISDRTRDRTSAILTVTPIDMLSFNASAGFGREEYPGTNFGLRSNDNDVYSVGFDLAPMEAVVFGVNYGWEKYMALQASRTANPLPALTEQYFSDPTQQFNDPRRDWTDDATDEVNTFTASLELLKLIPKTELAVTYDLSRAESTYVYGLVPNTVIAAPVQLPPVLNRLQQATVDGQYFITRQIAVGMTYMFDDYDVNDFALEPTSSLASPAVGTPSLMLIGYNYRPYTANTFWGRLTYFW